MDSEVINRIIKKTKSFSKNKKIIAAYIFGSALKNPAKARDVDICFITKDMSLDEMSAIAMEFDSPADISFMERMPNYLAFKVLREGKTLFLNDISAFIPLWKATVNQYIGMKYFRENVFKGVLKWMSSKT